jgi:hypothetical protein
MKLIKKQLLATALLVALGASPLTVMGESASDNGAAGSLSAAAHLNLRVTIPRFLHFRVGTAGGTIDQILFEPTDADVGDGTAVTGTGGDAGGGAASVAIRSNAGAITITAINDGGTGGLGTAGDISLSEITVLSDNVALPTPALSDAGNDISSPSLNGGVGSNVTNQTATWTYSYENNTTPDAGNYDAQITYTAASL